MYDIPEDYLLTYDPDNLDFYSDSTDFEDTQIQEVNNKKKNKKLVSIRNKRNCKDFVDGNKSNKFDPEALHSLDFKSNSKEMLESKAIYNQDNKELEVLKSYVTKKSRLHDSGDQIEPVNSKRSLMRHKVIPCFSGMFKRTSNPAKRMSIIKDKLANTDKENACQTFCVNYDGRMRNLDRKQPCYVTQPAYVPERKANPIPKTKHVRRPLLTHKIQRREYSNAQYSLTSSSEVERMEVSLKQNRRPCNIPTENDNIKCYLDNSDKPNKDYFPHIKKSPSKRRRQFLSQVYANPCQRCNNNTVISTDTCSNTSAVPSTCSGFWDYLFNKINNKYQMQRPEFYRPCDCKHSHSKFNSYPLRTCPQKGYFAHPCTIDPCTCNPCVGNSSSPKQSRCDKVDCSCSPQVTTNTCSCNTPPEQSPASLNTPISPKQADTPKTIDSPTPKKSPTPSKAKSSPSKVDCECPKDLQKRSQSIDAPKPCQVPHDTVTNIISQKYNGEILCIHNPPCVLINGCLNLPVSKQEPRVAATMWPVVECNRASFEHIFRHKYPKNCVDQSCQYETIEQACQFQAMTQIQCELMEDSCQYQTIEQGCQYQIPSTEQYNFINHSCQYYPETINAHQLTEHRQEKIVQSSCNHKPPCEVKRICHRPKYDPKLQTSCVHVPLCDNLPTCMVDSSNMDNGKSKRICRHKPKCTEIPICKKNYYIDFLQPTKEEAGTQVRPKSKMLCRHEPPCLMIPKCLGRVCAEACFPSEAIPDCVHQPMCEMMPACCRKSAKEMVSVRSQHPNSCRIV